MHAPIQNNPQFWYGNRGDRIFDDDFFIFANEDNLTSRKTWGMLTENSTLKSLNELKDILGERLTQKKYDSIKVGWKRAKKKYQIEIKKGTKLLYVILWVGTKRGQNVSELSSQKIPEHMMEKR